MLCQLLHPRDCGGAQERRLRVLERARPCLCVAEAEEELALDPRVDARLEFERLEGEFEESCRLLVREQADRSVAGAASVRDRSVDLSCRGSTSEVVRQLGEVRLEERYRREAGSSS